MSCLTLRGRQAILEILQARGAVLDKVDVAVARQQLRLLAARQARALFLSALSL